MNFPAFKSSVERPLEDEVCLALVGNPNAGKTTLFNALTGLRAKTSNFPGTTIEHRAGRLAFSSDAVRLIDLPGLYSINPTTVEERTAREALLGTIPGLPAPQGVILLLDATHLERNLHLASQVLELRRPTVVALNMIDLAERDGIEIDTGRLAAELGCPVVPVSARSGRGIPELRAAIQQLVSDPVPPCLSSDSSALCDCDGCPFAARYDWAEEVGRRCLQGPTVSAGQETERIDRVVTHPVVGAAAFILVMMATFSMIFWIAQYPMDWIEAGFGAAGSFVGGFAPAGRPAEPRRRRGHRRSRGRARLPAADLHPVFLPRAPRGHRLPGPRRVRDGPRGAQGRAAGQGVRADALGSRLRRAGDHGDANHRRPARPAGDDPRRPAADLLGEDPGLRDGRRAAAAASPARRRLVVHGGLPRRYRRRARDGAAVQAHDFAGATRGRW